MGSFNSPFCGRCALDESPIFCGTTLDWVPSALWRSAMPTSPLHSLLNIAQHGHELTPHGEKLTGNALKALLAPCSLSMLMEEADAKESLKQVAAKVETRAFKKAKAEAEAAEAANLQRGRKRAEQRAAIGARLPKTQRLVDTCGNAHVF